MKTAIIVDSTAYIEESPYKERTDIFELGLETRFSDGTKFLDVADPEVQDEFYKKLKMSEELPKTSQPAPGKYKELLDQIIAEGYENVLCVHLSQTFSGTYQTAKMITEEYEDQLNAHVVDSKGISAAIVALVGQAIEMLEANVPFEEVCEKTDWSAANSTIYGSVADLNNLVKGGRMNSTIAKIGTALKIRPLVRVGADGDISLVEKTRTDKKVNKRMAEFAAEDYKNNDGLILGFAHANDAERLEGMVSSVLEALPESKYHTGTMGPVIGTHTGSGTIGMVTIPKATY